MTHRLIQLSDLHFGTHDAFITEALVKHVQALKPDSLVVCGDLTMRAKVSQFKEASQFLKKFSVPTVVVPGNHDIPLYNLFRRFYKPLHRFRNYIAAREESHFAVNGLIVIGLNSSRSLTIKGGDISSHQIRVVESILEEIPKTDIKILATHHPINKISHNKLHKLMEGGINIFLSGHGHRSSTELLAKKIREKEHTALMVEAGTSSSRRYRDEHNSYNCLTFKGHKLTLETYTWQETIMAFAVAAFREYKREHDRWIQI